MDEATSESFEDRPGRLGELSRELLQLRETLRLGGGVERIQRQRDQGKLTARDGLHLLLDPDSTWAEIGLLIAHDQYDGQAPGAGVVTGVGVVEGREVVVVANDATVKAGSWWPAIIHRSNSASWPICPATRVC